MARWRSSSPADCCRSHSAALRLEVARLREADARYREALLAILKDPQVQMPDEYRDEGWVALGGKYPLST